MPNALAMLALVAWPAISAVLFRALPPGRALIGSILIAYLFLPPPPAGLDLPGLPPLTKVSIPSLAALALAWLMVPDRVEILPKSMVARICMAVFVFGPLITVATNPSPVFYERVSLPGLGARDAVALLVQQSILLMPFLLGRCLLRHPDDQRDILLALMLGGLVYSLPMLAEVRLSPQLNLWIYGYFQHSFEQMIRFGGFRPIVFLYHGIWVAFFALTAILSTAALARAEPSRRALFYWGALAYLLVVLVLAKSLASILYAALFVPIFLMLGRRWMLNLAVFLAFLAIAYPLLKGAGLVPEQALLNAASAIDADRAASLEFRFNNEHILLDRAYEKPLFGWGSWGRNHILDGVTGALLTVTDGRWVILIGIFGWLGFLAEFGLLTLPIFLLWWRARGADMDELSPWTAPLALMLAINVVDLIPNATLTPLTWLLCGALLGYAETWAPARHRVRARIRTIL